MAKRRLHYKKSGPFKVQFKAVQFKATTEGTTTEGNSEEPNSRHNPNPSPPRNYDCKNYQSCLELAATLNWDSFTCTHLSGLKCSGDINEKLVWQAHLAQRSDKVAKRICELPNIVCIEKIPGNESGGNDNMEKGEEAEAGKTMLHLKHRTLEAS